VRTPIAVGVVLERDSGLAFVRALEQIPKATLVWVCDRRPRRDDGSWGPWVRTSHVDDASRTRRST
jgi:hypothetical protein